MKNHKPCVLLLCNMRIGVHGTHAKAEGCRVGHELQLQALSSEMRMRQRSSHEGSPYNRVYFVSGPTDIGKRTFVTRLWEILAEGETPEIILTIDPRSEEAIDKQLINMATSNQSYFDWLLEQLSGEIEDQSRRYAESGKEIPQIGRLALWSGLIQRRIVENPDVRTLQIVVVLHSFSSLPELYRKLLARALPQETENVDVRIIATGEDAHDAIELNELFFDRSPVVRVSLPTITLNDVEKWLYSKALPVEFAEEVLAWSGGLPGKLDEACQAVASARDGEILANIAQNALRDVPMELRKYVCMASLLPEVNRDSLRAIMHGDQLLETLAVLHRCNWPDCWWDKDCFIFGRRVGRALQSYLENNDEPTFCETHAVTAQFTEICAAIPSYADKESLVRLLAFNYFNRHALLDVMPETAEKQFAFAIRNVGTYFEKSGESIRIIPSIRQIAEKYAVLTNHPNDNITRYKVERLWMLRKKALSDSIAKCGKNLDRDTEAMIVIKHQMHELDADLKNERGKRLGRLKSKLKSDDAILHGTTISGVIMQGVGTSILYLCLISSSKTAIIYALFGLAMIVTGLFKGNNNKQRSLEKQEPESSDGHDEEETSGVSGVIRCDLEMKLEWLASKISTEKREMRVLVRKMDEPYSKYP